MTCWCLDNGFRFLPLLLSQIQPWSIIHIWIQSPLLGFVLGKRIKNNEFTDCSCRHRSAEGVDTGMQTLQKLSKRLLQCDKVGFIFSCQMQVVFLIAEANVKVPHGAQPKIFRPKEGYISGYICLADKCIGKSALLSSSQAPSLFDQRWIIWFQ